MILTIMLVTRENICGIKEEILISRLILFFFFPAASIRTRDFSSVLSTNSTFPPLSCKYGRATFVSSHLNESHSSTNANSPMPLSMYNKFGIRNIYSTMDATGVHLSSGVQFDIEKV